MANTYSKSAQDNRANQLNPTHPAYYRSRGFTQQDATIKANRSKPVLDNRSEQLNLDNAVRIASQDQT
jgi:hypothetical protein